MAIIIHGEDKLAASRVFEVKSDSDPLPEVLLIVREMIKQGLLEFQPDREALTNTLKTALPDYAYSVGQVASYLVDEHEQSQGSTLLISPSTGKAIARLEPQDFYTPAPVPRETGGLVQRTLQIKPQVQAAIFSHYHEAGRDSANKGVALAKTRTELPDVVRERRVQFVTRAGRKSAALEIHERLPKLIESAQGLSRSLFDHFPLLDQPLGDETPSEVSWIASIQCKVQDYASRNLYFDPISWASAAIAASWARQLGAWVLSNVTPTLPWDGGNPTEGVYLAGPSTSKAVKAPNTFPVNGPEGVLVSFHGIAGYLIVEDYSTMHREVHDNWVVEAQLRAKVYVDPYKIIAYKVHLEPEEPSVEVL